MESVDIFFVKISISNEHKFKTCVIFAAIFNCKQQNNVNSSMPRPQQHRKIFSPPLMLGFKPFGIPRRELESIILQYDEFEAIRLLDYEGLMQEQAAERMNVSRPTLTRIYENARKTIAEALVAGKMILIEGGNVEFDRTWFRCKRCFKLVDGIENHVHCKNCSKFGSEELIPIHTDNK